MADYDIYVRENNPPLHNECLTQSQSDNEQVKVNCRIEVPQTNSFSKNIPIIAPLCQSIGQYDNRAVKKRIQATGDCSHEQGARKKLRAMPLSN